MPKKKSSFRIARLPFHCTICGGKLPENKSKWGLIWDSGENGVCSTCLHEIREKIGYYDARNKRNRKDS